MSVERPKLTLGPLHFHWPATRRRDFYARIADEAPVDTVVLGEVVCSKRAPFFDSHIPEVAERLRRAGKEVVLGSLALVMQARERQAVMDLAASEDFLVEANDLTAVAACARRPHAIGPLVAVYNPSTLELMARQGATRVCLPGELTADAIGALAGAAMATGTQLEVQAFGRLPLAISARCYHARAHGLHKDGCRYVCEKHPDGMDLDTLDGAPFLAVNGVQTLSGSYLDLLGDLGRLRSLGVDRFRLSPQDCDMVAVAETFHAVLDGTLPVTPARDRLRDLCPGRRFSNGFLHGVEGMAYRAAGNIA
ncbi:MULTISPECIES: ubiquinone anaerobic biosynthesis protein UbiV [Nitrospirillum]|uniref:Ubiquinone biosynthesis protein UbiV n=1 Tax=Nitrospirillum amazonense TaxID=28077 RepID=A0A560FJA9_9PROT|nr:U32 family peptidase [Nitrospirillum amazonense]MEC4592334.1 U32 family peptidase [Nitrospirillum amazonense]TWB21691.1 collagenase-like PrtC family protease [Nitrospirillum amazonense]